MLNQCFNIIIEKFFNKSHPIIYIPFPLLRSARPPRRIAFYFIYNIVKQFRKSDLAIPVGIYIITGKSVNNDICNIGQ